MPQLWGPRGFVWHFSRGCGSGSWLTFHAEHPKPSALLLPSRLFNPFLSSHSSAVFSHRFLHCQLEDNGNHACIALRAGLCGSCRAWEPEPFHCNVLLPVKALVVADWLARAKGGG